MKIKVGFGYDVHRLDEGIPLYIGGIKLEHEKGAVGHSDADVLIHAIMDALLGAAGMRDIGYHFPDTDQTLKGIDSKILLKKVFELIEKAGFRIGNIDATVALQRPKIGSRIPEMQEKIAEILQLSQEDVSIKATTTEKLGFVGSEAGIASYATVLIYKV
jgi:2-C-methyl-D-erythritol 2,4-cyclodiphosphate synthase